MGSNGVNPAAEQWGTMALATTARSGVSYRTSWMKIGWAFEFLDFWDDFSADGKLTDLAVPRPAQAQIHGAGGGGHQPGGRRRPAEQSARLAGGEGEPGGQTEQDDHVPDLLAFPQPHESGLPNSPPRGVRAGAAGRASRRIGSAITTPLATPTRGTRPCGPCATYPGWKSAPCGSSVRWSIATCRRRSGRRRCTTSARCARRRPFARQRAIDGLGGLRRQAGLLSRHVHARLELRAGDGVPLRRSGLDDARDGVRPRHRRQRQDELPREPAAGEGAGVAARRRGRPDGLPDEALPRVEALGRPRDCGRCGPRRKRRSNSAGCPTAGTATRTA